MSTSDDTHATLTLLEGRLHRLEFLLTGSSDQNGSPKSADVFTRTDHTVIAHLRNLNSKLDGLRDLDGTAGSLIKDIENLYSTHPELFDLPSTTIPSDLSTMASVVLAHATLFPETASRLSSLQSLQLPPAEQSAKLLSLAHDIAACQLTQSGLEAETRDLQERTVRSLEWWVKVGVVGTNDMWEELEGRIRIIERQLARIERKNRDEDGYL